MAFGRRERHTSESNSMALGYYILLGSATIRVRAPACLRPYITSNIFLQHKYHRMFPFRNRTANLRALVKKHGEDRSRLQARLSSSSALASIVRRHNCYCNDICCAKLNSSKKKKKDRAKILFSFFFLYSLILLLICFLVESSECTFTLVIVSLLTPDIESLLHTHVTFFCIVCIFTSLIFECIRRRTCTRCVEPFRCHFRECSLFTSIPSLID